MSNTRLNFNRSIIVNVSAVFGSTVTTSALGVLYWAWAARVFPHSAIGLASAAISAMTLLGMLGVFGLGTFLIGRLPQQRENVGRLIMTALFTTAVAAGALGIVGGQLAAQLSIGFHAFIQDTVSATLFVVGVSLTAVVIVFDQALIGLLRGDLHLWRNITFAVGKLVVLWVVSLYFQDITGRALFASWVVANTLSLLNIVIYLKYRRVRIFYLPSWSLLQELRGQSLKHHILNIVVEAPGLLLPILVVGLVSPQANASFYISWMIVTLVYAIPVAFATVLYAVNSADTKTLAQRLRFTLSASCICAIAGMVVLMLTAPFILGIFSLKDAPSAEICLRVLALIIPPASIRSHYITLGRIHNRIMPTTLIMLLFSLLELIIASIGGHHYGLVGFCVALAIVGWIVAAVLLPSILKILQPPGSRLGRSTD